MFQIKYPIPIHAFPIFLIFSCLNIGTLYMKNIVTLVASSSALTGVIAGT